MGSQQETAGNGSPRLGGSGTSVLGHAQEQVGHSPEQAGLTRLEQKVGLETSLDPLQPELSHGLVVWGFQCPRKAVGEAAARTASCSPPRCGVDEECLPAVSWPVLGVHSQRCQGPTANMQISDSTAGNPSGTCRGGRDTSRKTGRRCGIAAGGSGHSCRAACCSVQAGMGL